ncbi:glutathione S-transferase family protein [Croceicoccus naphthovorans]|uniref:Glutathione S-transferase n=1 Tax=Croceicoccus naphthovorans TaxID=1348774 RepID=A0A0G3XF20_9SPHN|nr:glutathione S-transferase family protein [Croceicoccus naphthovorans]AKM09236.1 glutathione S-transferase [Croceicoccus naphthovorans]MBB3990376.1 glutathione S-transferase [Croceicoccus naphthovorans]
MLELYGHPFSSYTWKAQIALHAADLDYKLHVIDPGHPDNMAFVAKHGGPFGKFPVLDDDGTVVFEATSIIEHLAAHHQRASGLIPSGRAEKLRNLDRVFDNYVMNVMNIAVYEQMRAPDAPDTARQDEARAQLRTVYAWLESRADALCREHITLVDCAAAPSLFYADWVEPIGDDCPDLQALRARLLALPEVVKCVDAAYPYRQYFPLGAPDRD